MASMVVAAFSARLRRTTLYLDTLNAVSASESQSMPTKREGNLYAILAIVSVVVVPPKSKELIIRKLPFQRLTFESLSKHLTDPRGAFPVCGSLRLRDCGANALLRDDGAVFFSYQCGANALGRRERSGLSMLTPQIEYSSCVILVHHSSCLILV